MGNYTKINVKFEIFDMKAVIPTDDFELSFILGFLMSKTLKNDINEQEYKNLVRCIKVLFKALNDREITEMEFQEMRKEQIRIINQMKFGVNNIKESIKSKDN
jgi:hypothetical protein